MKHEHPLRTWRLESRLSLKALVERINDGQADSICGIAHLSQIEARGKVPSVKLAMRLQAVTGLSLEAIVGAPQRGAAE